MVMVYIAHAMKISILDNVMNAWHSQISISLPTLIQKLSCKIIKRKSFCQQLLESNCMDMEYIMNNEMLECLHGHFMF